MGRSNVVSLSLLGLLLVSALAVGSDAGKSVSVKGYVLDSACAFTKNLKEPISAECAVACAKAGSPLVTLATTAPSIGRLRTPRLRLGRTNGCCRLLGKKLPLAARFFGGVVRAPW